MTTTIQDIVFLLLAQSCPECGAEIGKPCIDAEGPHLARAIRAVLRQDEPGLKAPESVS